MLYKTGPVTWRINAWSRRRKDLRKKTRISCHKSLARHKSPTIFITARYVLVTILFLCFKDVLKTSVRPSNVIKKGKRRNLIGVYRCAKRTCRATVEPVFPHECPPNRIWTPVARHISQNFLRVKNTAFTRSY